MFNEKKSFWSLQEADRTLSERVWFAFGFGKGSLGGFEGSPRVFKDALALVGSTEGRLTVDRWSSFVFRKAFGTGEREGFGAL